MSENPAIYEAMALQGDPASYQDSPEAAINIGGQMVDPQAVVASTMQLAGTYMKKNGPIQPMHSLVDREAGLDQNKMTKAQVKEQVMNEDQGYPSNLEEANKTKELENRVAGMETGINQILVHLQNGPVAPSSPPSPPLSVPIGGSPASPGVLTMPSPVPMPIAPQPNPSPSTPIASPVPVPKPQPRRQVTLSDGRKITEPGPASPMSLGPAVGVQEQPPTQLEAEDFEDADEWGDAQITDPQQEEEIVEEIDVEQSRKAAHLLKVQQLVQEVNAFMAGNDVHRFWRRHVANSLHRNIGYNGWPKQLQVDFDARFKGFLEDPVFISSLCDKIAGFELGHALGVKHVVAFIVAAAGFTAFTVSQI